MYEANYSGLTSLRERVLFSTVEFAGRNCYVMLSKTCWQQLSFLSRYTGYKFCC